MDDNDLIQFFKLDPPCKNDSPTSNISTWNRGRVIGEGTFGTVWLETHSLDARMRAVKQVKRHETSFRGKVNQELLAMTRLSRPKYVEHFAHFFGWYEEGPNLSLAMEFFELGDLRKHMRPETPLPETQCRDIMQQLLTGLDILHNDGFAHRDLKPENIFVLHPSPQWRVKIGDFGIAKRSWNGDTLLRSRSGTLPYMAPEIFQWVDNNDEEAFQYTQAVDIWSIGIMLFELLAGERPFNDERSLKRYCDGKLEFPEALLKKFEVTPYCYQLTQELLSLNPHSRPSAAQSLSAPWFTNEAMCNKHRLGTCIFPETLAAPRLSESNTADPVVKPNAETTNPPKLSSMPSLDSSEGTPSDSCMIPSLKQSVKAEATALVSHVEELNTAIWTAVLRKDINMVTTLLSHCPDVEFQRLSCEFKRVESECPLRQSFTVPESATLLAWAVSLNETEIVKLLLTRGANPNGSAGQEPQDNHAPLYYVCDYPWEKNAIRMMRILCDHGASVTLELMVSSFARFNEYIREYPTMALKQPIPFPSDLSGLGVLYSRMKDEISAEELLIHLGRYRKMGPISAGLWFWLCGLDLELTDVQSVVSGLLSREPPSDSNPVTDLFEFVMKKGVTEDELVCMASKLNSMSFGRMKTILNTIREERCLARRSFG